MSTLGDLLKKPARDIVSGGASALRLSPPGKATQFALDYKNNTRLAQNPRQDMQDAYKAIRAAGYAAPVAPLMGGLMGLGTKILANVTSKKPLLHDYAPSVAGGMDLGALSAGLSPIATIIRSMPKQSASPIKRIGEFGQTLRADRRFTHPWQ